jgi:hypothetical protein
LTSLLKISKYDGDFSQPSASQHEKNGLSQTHVREQVHTAALITIEYGADVEALRKEVCTYKTPCHEHVAPLLAEQLKYESIATLCS